MWLSFECLWRNTYICISSWLHKWTVSWRYTWHSKKILWLAKHSNSSQFLARVEFHTLRLTIFERSYFLQLWESWFFSESETRCFERWLKLFLNIVLTRLWWTFILTAMNLKATFETIITIGVKMMLKSPKRQQWLSVTAQWESPDILISFGFWLLLLSQAQHCYLGIGDYRFWLPRQSVLVMLLTHHHMLIMCWRHL